MWGVAIFVAAFLISLAVTVVLLIRIPETYFLDRPTDANGSRVDRVPWGPLRVLKNILGVLVIGAGVVMLITPGQGVLTILIGIMLLDFPGKRRWERKLIRRPRINQTINRIRARFGKPPLLLDSEISSAAVSPGRAFGPGP